MTDQSSSSIERHFRAEREACEGRDHAAVTITMLASGAFRARMNFQPGMESASADGDTILEALARLDALLGR